MDGVLLEATTTLVGPDLEARQGIAVEVIDDRITSIGERAGSDSARRIDLSGHTLLPGFIDAHVHIAFHDPRDVITNGVTTVRDLAWPPDAIFRLAERSRSADFFGPTILAAGPMLTVAGGYPTRAGWAPPGTERIVGDASDARAAVQERVEEGATIVKVALNAAVGPTLDRDVLDAICDEAHSHGLKVTGHVYGLGELIKALDAGMDELAHMLMSPELIPDEVIARMVDQDMTVVPTLAVHRGRSKRVAMLNLAGFVEAGGRVVYGTDLGNEGVAPGIDRNEIDRMERSGMDGLAIIGSATAVAASWLGLTDRGVVEVGRRADLIAVEGDPLDAPIQLRYVGFVMRGGTVLRAPAPREP